MKDETHLQRQLDRLANRYNELGRKHVALLRKSGNPVDHCGECDILKQTQRETDQLRSALSDLLNDCINFDGGQRAGGALTNAILENAAKVLRTPSPPEPPPDRLIKEQAPWEPMPKPPKSHPPREDERNGDS